MSDLSLIVGETFSHVYIIVNTDGTAIDLTGYTLLAFAQPQTQIPNEAKQIPITIAVAVAASGTVTVTIPPETSSTFTTNNPITLLLQATQTGTIDEITITGTITETFAKLLNAGELNSKDCYVSTGDPLDISAEDCLFWNITEWILYHNSGTAWSSSENVPTPDLVETWTPISPAENTPIINANIINAINHSIRTPPILILPSLPNGSW
jgi:hypothetical protein